MCHVGGNLHGTCITHVNISQHAHFYSILSFILVCALIFYMSYYFSHRAGHMALPSGQCSSATAHVNQLTDCEHGGYTLLTIHTVYEHYF